MASQRQWFSVVIMTLAILMASAPALAERRVALVIGNAAYQHTRILPNPRNDAEAIAKVLRDIGFEVTVKTDQGYGDMRRAIRDFGQSANGADIAVIHFAGHGLELAGENYLLPVDAKVVRDGDLEYEAVTLTSVLSSVRGATKLRLVILDACRNNPLGDRMALSAGTTRAVARGLARVEPSGDVLVAYSAKHGTLALDGNGPLSPYADALVRHMATPGMDIRIVFGRVRDEVLAATERRQEPYIYGTLGGTMTMLVPGPSIDGVPHLAPPLLGKPEARPTEDERPSTVPSSFPNEPLPPDIPVAPDILRLVETHPFFGNAAAVSVRKYEVDSALTFVTTPGEEHMTSNSSDATSLRWLRRGIISTVSTSEAKVGNSAGALNSTTRNHSLEAANGLIGLWFKGVTKNRHGTTTTTTKLVRLENLAGTVFPVKVGNRFSYTATRRTTSSAGYLDDITDRNTCEVTRQYEARQFHPDVAGSAFLLECDTETEYRKTKSSNGRNVDRSVFFERLGIWVTADPVGVGDLVIKKADRQTTGKYTTITNGRYTLKSFSLSQ